MIHMMNANNFTSGVVHLTEGTDVAAFTEAMHTAISTNPWICGFPEKMIVAVIDGSYVLISFGVNDAMNPFEAHLSEVFLSTPNNQTDESKYEVLTEDDVCKIAKDYAVAMFGADIENYTLTNVFYQERYDRYFITFAKKYGKDGFATGEVCKAVVGSDGTVQSCTTPVGSALEGFDETLLNGITLDDVKEFAEKQAADIFDSLISSELTGVSIVNKDGKYMLRITYHHTAEQLDADTIDKYDIGLYQSPGNPQFKMSYYYPLEP